MVPKPTYQVEEADDRPFQIGAAPNVSQFPGAAAAAAGATIDPGAPLPGADVDRLADAATTAAQWRRLEEPSATTRLG